MNLNEMYASAGITTSLVFVGGIAYKIFRAVNGKRLRCRCCSYDLEMDFKVDDMPPSPTINDIPPPNIIINPMNK